MGKSGNISSKSANGEAGASGFKGVRKVSESSIEITFTYLGRRTREPLKVDPRRVKSWDLELKRAANFRERIIDAIAKGTFDYHVTFPNSRKTFASSDAQNGHIELTAFVENWQGTLSGLKASTKSDYRKTSNLIAKQFEGRTISSITRPEIKQWFDQMQAGAKRVRNIQSVFRVIFTAAMDGGLIQVNPLAMPIRVRSTTDTKPIEDEDDERIDPFSPEEQQAILAELTGQERNLIKFAFWTGMRTGELVALRWKDVSIEKGTVSVRRSKTQASDIAERPKTHAGRREFKLLKPALDALELQKRFTFDESNLDTEIFVDTRTGRPWAGDQPIRKRLWIPALKRAGVKYRYPYQTRHTFASMAFGAGENEDYVSRALGHASTSITRRHYVRLMPSAQNSHGEKMTAMYSDAFPEEARE